MGYTTRFSGYFDINRELTHKEWLELTELGECYDVNVYRRYTETPETIPDSYLQWLPNKDGTAIVWNEGEKFYAYIHWLRWLIKHYLKPRDIVLNGQVQYRGEDMDDVGFLTVKDNKVTTQKIKLKTVTCPHCDERFVPEDEE